MKKEIVGHISFGLSKAFDRINRNKLWWVLYEKGLPIKLIQSIKKGHENNWLQGKRNGVRGSKINNNNNNNKGVFQGSPISALLYIILADSIMVEYKQELIQKRTEKTKINMRNLDTEINWTNHYIKKKQNDNTTKTDEWHMPDPHLCHS